MTIQNSCSRLIKQIHDELEKSTNNALRPYNLTIVQAGILLALNEAEGRQLSLKDLEKRFHVAQPTMAGIVSRLERKGFVESLGTLDDKRIKKVLITQAGIDRCEKAELCMGEAETHILSCLTETERVIFFELLQKVRTSLNQAD